MSDFQPQTTFYLLKDIKLDHSYTNTMDFSNKEEQYNFFFSKKAFEVLEGTYQRKSLPVSRACLRGFIRVLTEALTVR